ncbi:MAG: SAM hydroxide adenosyltransferase, partial [Terriglobales bacterium]
SGPPPRGRIGRGSAGSEAGRPRSRKAAVWAVPIPARSPFVARDHLAGLAAQLAQGADPARLGQAAPDWRRLALPRPHPAPAGTGVEGQVLYVDRFGNLLTNFNPASVPGAAQAQICGVRIARWCSHFGDAPAGELCLLWGAEGWLEIVLAQGSAAQRLGAKTGDSVLLG